MQAALADKAPARKRRGNIRHPSLLAGLIFDGHGREMTPSHAVKQAKRYRYYITRNREVGSPTAWRVPAHDLEQIVIARLARHLAERPTMPQKVGGATPPDEGLLRLVANAHSAREAVVAAGARPFDEVAEASGFSAHYFAQLARLGGLAPDIVTSILEGRQPPALTRTRLARTKALPVRWGDQRRLFGFA